MVQITFYSRFWTKSWSRFWLTEGQFGLRLSSRFSTGGRETSRFRRFPGLDGLGLQRLQIGPPIAIRAGQGAFCEPDTVPRCGRSTTAHCPSINSRISVSTLETLGWRATFDTCSVPSFVWVNINRPAFSAVTPLEVSMGRSIIWVATADCSHVSTDGGQAVARPVPRLVSASNPAAASAVATKA